MGTFGIGLGKTAASGIVGMGLNALTNIFGKDNTEEQKKLMQLQNQYELQKMDYQFGLNQKAADYNQELAYDMWLRTNYGAQVEQMENANINPALLYGKSGGGGATTSGGRMDGVAMGTSNAVGMALQWEQIQAQTKLMKAEAMKATVEAAKAGGVETENTMADTKVKEKEVELKDSTITLNESIKVLKDAQTEWTWTDMYRIQADAHLMWQNARKIAVDADIAEETKTEQINKVKQESVNSIISGMEAVSRIKLNETQIKGIENDIKAIWAEIETKKTTAEAAKQNAETTAKRLTEEVKKWNKELDQKDTKLLQDWIYRGIESGIGISQEVRKWVYGSGK